jgi:hypothetical protein
MRRNSRGILVALTTALALPLVAACAGRDAPPPRFPGAIEPGASGPPPSSPATSPPAASSSPAPARSEADLVVETALLLQGTPYRNGGEGPSGFDCSGLVEYVFGKHDIALPRTVREQFHAGTSVARTDLAPGDLVFFSTVAAGPSHVGIVVEGDWFIHAPSSNGVVRIERLSGDYWRKRYFGARRVIARGSEPPVDRLVAGRATGSGNGWWAQSRLVSDRSHAAATAWSSKKSVWDLELVLRPRALPACRDTGCSKNLRVHRSASV